MEIKENIEKEGSREWAKIKDRILCEESKRRMAEMREKEIAGGKMQRHRKRQRQKPKIERKSGRERNMKIKERPSSRPKINKKEPTVRKNDKRKQRRQENIRERRRKKKKENLQLCPNKKIKKHKQTNTHGTLAKG